MEIQQTFIVPKLFTDEDLINLVICNQSKLGDFQKLFYALKNKILLHYGIFDGYDLQTWDDDFWYYEPESCDGDSYASHYHILGRYVIGGCVFHKPINQWLYIRWDGFSKESKEYRYFRKKIYNTINKKKELKLNTEGFSGLKQLVKKYGFFLREDV